MVSRRIVAVHMHYLLLQSLFNILQTGDLRFTVDFWMQVKLLTSYCIMVFFKKLVEKMFQLHLFGSFITGTIIYAVLFVGIM